MAFRVVLFSFCNSISSRGHEHIIIMFFECFRRQASIPDDLPSLGLFQRACMFPDHCCTAHRVKCSRNSVRQGSSLACDVAKSRPPPRSSLDQVLLLLLLGEQGEAQSRTAWAPFLPFSPPIIGWSIKKSLLFDYIGVALPDNGNTLREDSCF